MSNLTLYHISAEQLRINALLEESGGELTPELENALAVNRENFVAKADDYIATIRRYRDFADAADAEIARLQALKKTSVRIADRLKERLLSAMQAFDLDKVDVGLHKLSTRRTTSVVIEDESKLPHAYIIVETKPNKAALRADLKEGQSIPGASLTTNVTLQIR